MRVLFTCLPGYGHFNPLVPLARAVADSGHDVAFATSEDFCGRVVQAGFTAFPAGMSLRRQIEEAGRRYPQAGLPPGRERFEVFVPRMLAGVAAPARAADLVPIVRRWQPDVLVHDEAELAAPVAGAVAGIPWASHSIVLQRPPAMARLAGETIAPLSQEWGVDLGPLAGLYRFLHFDACPASLQPPGREPVPVAHAIRNTEGLDIAGDEQLPPWVAVLAPVPTIYVTLGTVFNRDRRLFAAILDGLRDQALNVVVTVGHDADPTDLGPQPANVHIERYIPLSLLLPHLDLVVTQGGTSILPALGHGLPLLVLPQAADQFHNADSCVAAGVGTCLLPRAVSPQGVLEEVRRLLNVPSFRRCARRVAQEIQHLPGPEEAARSLARLAEEQMPIVGR